MSLCENFKQLWANKNFVNLVICFALIFGVSCGIGSSLSNLLNPFGFTPSDIAMIGGACLLLGVISALVFGCILDYSAKYRQIHLSLSFLVFVAIVSIYLVMLTGDRPLKAMICVTSLMGIGFVSLFPVSLSYGAEITFPSQPSMVNACMNFSGQVCSFVVTALIIWITDIDASNDAIASEAFIERRKT